MWSTLMPYDKKNYTEVTLKGWWAYTGIKLKVVYMDADGTEFYNVESLALKYYS